jgi:hypothetical protein
MRKTYLYIYSHFLLYVRVGKDPIQVRFLPTGKAGKFNSSYSTEDAGVQKAIEGLPYFGKSLVLESGKWRVESGKGEMAEAGDIQAAEETPQPAEATQKRKTHHKQKVSKVESGELKVES